MQAFAAVARKGNQFQVLITHHVSQFPLRREDQQGFFKARNKSGEVFKIPAMLFVGVDRNGIKPMLLHGQENILQPLTHRFIADHRRFCIRESFWRRYRRKLKTDRGLIHRQPQCFRINFIVNI